MATQVQFRRGTTAQNNSFTGVIGELSVNTSVNALRIHDGSTSGGFELAKSNLSNISSVGVITATTFVGALTGTASNVTTNANLTGHVTSVGNAAVLGSFTSLQLLTALTDETGSGSAVFATSPTLVTPVLGTPTSGNLANCTFPTLNQNTSGSAATLTTGRTIAITGDLTYTSPSFNGSGNVTAAGTLATVNSNVGSFGGTGTGTTITVNAKGLITGITTFTASAGGLTLTDDTSTNASRFLTFTSATSGSISAANVSSTKLIYNPSTGSLSATDFNSTSDISLKDNIKIIKNPIEKVLQLNGVAFNWKENQKPSIGVIAQELEKVLPELVTQGDVKSVNYNGLIGVLIEAVKEQQKQIEELKDLVKDLTTPQ